MDDSSESVTSSACKVSDEEVSESADSEDMMAELMEESEMPIEELRRKYQQIAGESTSVAIEAKQTDYQEVTSEEGDTDASSDRKHSLFSRFMKNAANSGHANEDDDHEDVDVDYDPIFDLEDFYKPREPRIGIEYQVEFDEGRLLNNGQLEEDSERVGNLVWSPLHLGEESVSRYLLNFYGIYTSRSLAREFGSSTNGSSKHLHQDIDDRLDMLNAVPDHEHALFQLLIADFDIEEALRFWTINPPVYINVSPSQTKHFPNKINPIFDVWSEDEVRHFEWAIRLYGKRFNVIRDKSLPGRTVAELVNFYYWWKLTDRYREYFRDYKTDHDGSHHFVEPVDDVVVSDDHAAHLHPHPHHNLTTA